MGQALIGDVRNEEGESDEQSEIEHGFSPHSMR
jgi:hypothetical protein